MVNPRLDGKTVLITGANHGIGAATARAFAEVGARVFIHYLRLPLDADLQNRVQAGEAEQPGEARYRLNQSRGADEVLQTIREAGGRVEAHEADLSDPSVVPELFDRAEAAFGPVEVLVSNAAHATSDTFLPASVGEDRDINRVYSMHTVTAAGIDAHFAVNGRAMALMMAEFAQRHIARDAAWGRIINISSDGAYRHRSMVSYAASKSALESYTRSAADELGAYGITVNVASPGPIQTDYITPEVEKREVALIPLGRLGRPEDVADVIVFLASEQAHWLTGQTIYAGGGKAM